MERVENEKLSLARLWRNPPVRRLSVILASSLLITVVLIAVYSHYSTERLKNTWLDKEAAMLGTLYSEHPDLADKWLGQLSEKGAPTPEAVAEGHKIMERYGVASLFESRWLPVLQQYHWSTLWILISSITVLIALIAWLLFREYHKLLGQIRTLAVSLEDTVKHNKPMSSFVYDEGELGLLANGAQELTLRLRATIEQLDQDKAFLKDTVADISHQLKTPLASLMIYIELLQGDKLDPDHATEFLETCRGELDRMEWLTLALLKLARLEAGALEMSLREVPLMDTLQQAVKSISRLAEDKQIEMLIEHPDSELIIPHDPHWLAEAISNLLKNAIEHSPIGSNVSISLERTPVFVRVQVRDQGRGIEAQQLPHIFKKFYRSSTEGSGVGLGLPLAKSIIEKHGGILSVSANPLGGTIFNLTLPHHPFPMNAMKLTEL
ncbi:sensor histidine kinase [Cohnella abietis]|uniref:histidine kinase n=1 Tax=Cohnella abietis TaxID=2507935 RepID=A0A3T1CY40_9BACL|nr:HAMP domain-containing sensor histidine kinase [Cohnella abietis]BBI30782.1 two-component sensor histidine kinase [Cohnella abietis]